MNKETIKISNTGREMTAIFEDGEYFWEDEDENIHPILESEPLGISAIECGHCEGVILNSFESGDFVECEICDEIIIVK